MKPATGAAARRIQALLGEGFQVLEFEESTRSAAEAAAAIGCSVAEIAKSLIFRAASSDRSVLVVASGTNRVDEAKIAGLLGEPVARADPDFVRARTGFAIGGVAPFGHATAPVTWLDADLQAFPTVWVAAGAPNAVVALTPADLQRLTGADFADIALRR